IAAALEAFDKAAQAWGWEADMGTGGETAEIMRDHENARAALDAAILHHLRAYAEMKAALDLQNSGGA
ncbi:hypothetical protein, partial [Methylobacterium sp. WL7]|uniref:hypothetical protein n=1 Tax=Methylobacterium sp. WL7 TaxID=2603900 RepID=UPI001AEDF7B2